MNPIRLAAQVLLLLKWLAQLGLAQLNERHVRRQAGTVPEPWQSRVTPEAYARSVRYTLAKSRLHQLEITWSLLVGLTILFSGVLPRAFQGSSAWLGDSAWANGAFLFLAGLAVRAAELPFDWYAQFRLEERFGFNTATQAIWWLDRLKGLLLAAGLGYPLLVLVLKLVDWAGSWWWLWAWGTVLGFELVMVVLAPILILPLFNRFTPLSQGGLRQQLLAVAERTGFRVRSIQVMDGSKRSRHSNAFFTSFGRFRKIVLFDTLLEQLNESELAAVLAHEIGHDKKGHIPKLLGWSAAGQLVGFGALAWLARAEWFSAAFGLPGGNLAAGLLLFGLLAGTVTYWLTPLANYWSRRFEYEADAFAAQTMGGTDSLLAALRKLNEKNLSNLTPHPLYSGFYYSHPTLLERERALGGSVRREKKERGPLPSALDE